MMRATLRNALTALLLTAGFANAHATTVLAVTDKIVQFDAVKESFVLPAVQTPGTYDVSVLLADLGTAPFSPFTSLGLNVLQPTTNFGSLTQPGTLPLSHLLSGSYDIWTLGQTSGIGLFGLKVDATFVPSPVPLPAAAFLFGPALAGLLAFGRRRRSIAA